MLTNNVVPFKPVSAIPNADSRGLFMYADSGRRIYPDDPRPADFHIRDIAEGLSKESRYNGQTPLFYSVAQHSVLVSLAVAEEYALEALLHDASEAYLKDLPSVIKHHPLMQGYLTLEGNFMKAIRERFKLPQTPSPAIKMADALIVAAEARDLFRKTPPISASFRFPKDHIFNQTIVALPPHRARKLFLDRFYDLQRARTAAAAVAFKDAA
jgi:hypothetical protein